MTDNLDQLTDAELSEVFAVEAAGWTRSGPSTGCVLYPPGLHPQSNILGHDTPSFATDANAVLPWLDGAGIWDAHYVKERGGYAVSVGRGEDAEAPTFARAACIALIRAKRAGK